MTLGKLNSVTICLSRSLMKIVMRVLHWKARMG